MKDAAGFALIVSLAVLLLACGFVWGAANAESHPIASCDSPELFAEVRP